MEDLLQIPSPGSFPDLSNYVTADFDVDEVLLGSNEVTTAEENSASQSNCQVCGDESSGNHYGVQSCEGCKGFFRRSIQKLMKYQCSKDGKCEISKVNRNRCQYCRFKKCLAVGMSRDSVRYGRMSKRTKTVNERQQKAIVNDQTKTQEELAVYDLILAVSSAYTEHMLISENKVPKTETIIPPAGDLIDLLDLTKKVSSFERLTKLIGLSLNPVAEFLKSIPGFYNLSTNDQLGLLKGGFLEIWIISISRTFDVNNNTLTVQDGSQISKDDLESAYNSDLVSCLFNFVENFMNLNLSNTDLALFCAVVFFTPDRVNVTDKNGVSMLQGKLMEALKMHMSRNHSTEPQLFASVLLKIPELRILSAKHNDALEYFKERDQLLYTDEMFAEIFNMHPVLQSE